MAKPNSSTGTVIAILKTVSRIIQTVVGINALIIIAALTFAGFIIWCTYPGIHQADVPKTASSAGHSLKKSVVPRNVAVRATTDAAISITQ